MTIEIKAPSFPESVTDGTVATWYKKPGEPCLRDELIADIETDKVVIEINAPAQGMIANILKIEGETVISDELIAHFEAGEIAQAPPPAVGINELEAAVSADNAELIISPAAKKMMAENDVENDEVTGTGKAGRVTKEDVQAVIEQRKTSVSQAAVETQPAPTVIAEVALTGDRTERRVPMTRLRGKSG